MRGDLRRRVALDVWSIGSREGMAQLGEMLRVFCEEAIGSFAVDSQQFLRQRPRQEPSERQNESDTSDDAGDREERHEAIS